jgi:hypothetical protein
VITGSKTRAAADAPLGTVQALTAQSLALRIMAPLAAQRAALEKDSGADPGTIVHRELFYVEYQASRQTLFTRQSKWTSQLIIVAFE